MPRQRFIHPEIWSDPTLGKLAPVERLFFIGCFSNADDEGRLLGSPAYLRSVIFVYDDFTIDQVKEIRDRVVSCCHNLVLYEHNGTEYLAFLKWTEYQKPKYPQPSKIPSPPGVETKPVAKWYVPKAIRQRVFEKFNHRCVVCGSTEDIEIDHIIPLKHGGTSDEENLQVMCSSCNNKKHDKLPDQNSKSNLENHFPNLEKNSANLAQNSSMGLGLGLGSDRDRDWEGGMGETHSPDGSDFDDGPKGKKPGREGEDTGSSEDSASGAQDAVQNYAAEFERFYAAYPRQTGKIKALNAWSKLQKLPKKIRPDPEELIAAARHYAQECKQKKRDQEVIKYPATFLSARDRNWEDYVKGVPSGKPVDPERERRRELIRQLYEN